jgi:signal peptidase I
MTTITEVQSHRPEDNLGGNSASAEGNVAAQVRQAIRNSRSACLRVSGGSMLPWIRPDDILLIRATPFDVISRGDIVLYSRGDRLFVHRAIRRFKSRGAAIQDRLVTKGDALPHADYPISRAEFLGRVVRIHRGRRHKDLEAPWHVALSWLLSRVSSASRIVYPVAHLAKTFLLDPITDCRRAGRSVLPPKSPR